jgi:predicted membrane-bound spermidine synthase
MKQPVWKRLLSYLVGFKLECASSDINPQLDVYLKQGRYQLCTPHAVYSYGDLYDNFTRSFDAMDLDLLDIKRVLVLGFGLGSIPVILEKVFEKQYDYTAIEVDCKVIDLAKKYVLPEIESSVELVCDDAFQFVMNCKEQFDMIAVDIFLDDAVPLQFEQKDFLLQLKNILTAEGVLLYNRLSFNKKDKIATQYYFDNTFTNVFPQSTYLDVDGNWMLLNRESALKGVFI